MWILAKLLVKQLMKKLGITNPNFFKGDLIRVDIEASQLKKLNLRSTTGTEVGSYSQYVPGNKQSVVYLKV